MAQDGAHELRVFRLIAFSRSVATLSAERSAPRHTRTGWGRDREIHDRCAKFFAGMYVGVAAQHRFSWHERALEQR